MTQASSAPPLLALLDVAERLGISYSSAISWAHRGMFPTVRVGARLFVEPSALERLERDIPRTPDRRSRRSRAAQAGEQAGGRRA